jgi:hypothetical protein
MFFDTIFHNLQPFLFLWLWLGWGISPHLKESGT